MGVNGVFVGDGNGEGGGGGTECGDGPDSCKFSFSISNIVFRSP